jgi:AcrR family transcriptional regulator
MTRPKTISDEAILAVAREVFRTQGHAASTREVARQAGISEAVLYQRFGTKDDLFFASMVPSAPDIEKLLGPDPPTKDGRAFVHDVVLRMAAYFGEVIPLAIHVMIHPSFDRAAIERAQAGPARLQEALVRRLRWFEAQGHIRKSSAVATARLLVSLAHDSALPGAARGAAQRTSELASMAAIVWNGIAEPDGASDRATKRSKR